MKAVNVIYIANTSVEENLSRKDMLAWVNKCLGTNLTKVEEMCSGCFYLQFMDLLFPKTVPMKKVKFNTFVEYDMITNLKLLQEIFKKLGVKRIIEIEKLTKGRYQDNWEFLQWFKRFADANDCEEKVANYIKPAFLENTGNKSKKTKKDIAIDSNKMSECIKGKLEMSSPVAYQPKTIVDHKQNHVPDNIVLAADERKQYRPNENPEKNVQVLYQNKNYCLPAKDVLRADERNQSLLCHPEDYLLTEDRRLKGQLEVSAPFQLNASIIDRNSIKGNLEMSSPVAYQPMSSVDHKQNHVPYNTGSAADERMQYHPNGNLEENLQTLYQNKNYCLPAKDVLRADERIQSLLCRPEDYLLTEDRRLKGQLEVSAPFHLNSSIMDNLVYGTEERIQGLRLRPEDSLVNEDRNRKGISETNSLVHCQPQNVVLGTNERSQTLRWFPQDYLINEERRVAVSSASNYNYLYGYGIQVDHRNKSIVKKQRDFYYHKIRYVEYYSLTDWNKCGVNQILNTIYSLNEKIKELNEIYKKD